MKKILLAACLGVLASAAASAKTFEIDPAHSSVAFRVKHFKVTNVRGRFDKFTGAVDYDKAQPKSWKTQVEIDAASVNTNVSKRDDHLRSADFFDVAKCPKLSFKTTSIDEIKGDSAKLHGELTMHCQTKPVTLQLELGGVEADPKGNEHLGASATGKISRKDWGMESGAPMVGDEVEIDLDVEAIAKASAQEPAKKQPVKK